MPPTKVKNSKRVKAYKQENDNESEPASSAFMMKDSHSEKKNNSDNGKG